MPRTGTSKDLFELDLQEWLLRKHYGDDPFENVNIICRTQRCANCSSYQCMNCPCSDSLLIEERNKILGSKFKDRNQGDKTWSETRGK